MIFHYFLKMYIIRYLDFDIHKSYVFEDKLKLDVALQGIFAPHTIAIVFLKIIENFLQSEN